MNTIEELLQEVSGLGTRQFSHRLRHAELVDLRKLFWTEGFELRKFLTVCDGLGLYPAAVMRDLLDPTRGCNDIRPLDPLLLRVFPGNEDDPTYDLAEIPFEVMPKVPRRTIVDNYYRHPATVRWNGMVDRCIRPSSQNFHNYGERGIKVCDAWHPLNTNGRKNYCDWFDQELAKLGLSLRDAVDVDREDNNGNYCPRNCRLVPRNVNSQNTRSTRLTFDHVIYLRDQARELDLTRRGIFAANQARALGVSYPTVVTAIAGDTWENVNEVSPPVEIGGWTQRSLQPL